MPQDAGTNGRAPSSLDELRKLVESVDDGENDQVFLWLTYTYNMLTSRKAYHKKQQVKKALLMKVARQMQAADELAAIDKQAESGVTDEAND